MDKLLPLSVAVITLNESDNLSRCLASVQDIATELIVLDCGSTDDTKQIALSYGANFIYQPWLGHVAQKNRALEHCRELWVLSLDADEALSPELSLSIRALFSGSGTLKTGYLVNRRTFYLGDWIWHAWYPEWRLRLVRRDCAKWDGIDPHDYLTVKGTTERLKGDLYHYSYRNLNDHFERMVHYAKIMAQERAERGEHFRWYKLILSPWLAFIKRFIFKKSWRDGWRGWIISLSDLMVTSMKYSFLYEITKINPENKT